MLRRLIAFVLGHLRIEVLGGEPGRFLNLALQAGLVLWDVGYRGDSLWASLTVRDFRALRPAARGARCRVRIRARRGLPFLLARLRGRPALVAGAFLSLAAIWWCASHVWLIHVRITPPQNLDPRAIRAVAAEAGLRPGVWKGKVDVTAVQRHLQNRIGEIAWATVRLQGTRAIIEVVEKATRTPVPTGSVACVNLVARKSGVVEQVVAFQGEPVVRPGDVVRAGDLLVECAFRYWEGGRPLTLPGTPPPPRENVARTLVAQARVMARVPYSLYQEVPLVQEVEVPTGRTATRWVLHVRGQSILKGGEDGYPSRDGKPFAAYREERRVYRLGSWRNWTPPVELVIIRAEETEIRQEPVSLEQAVQQARERLDQQLRWMLSPSDRLLGPITAEVVEQTKNYAGIKVSAEVLEEISVPQFGEPVPVPRDSGSAEP
ncbi:MAG TPA: sporulation protein YqfD [Symbiobacteriaceae bacterium]